MPRIPGRKPKPGKTPALPATAVLEIVARDIDGEFLARPVKWDAPGDPPRILVLPGKEQDSGPALGIGLVLYARWDDWKKGKR